jgi:hypothetical protein
MATATIAVENTQVNRALLSRVRRAARKHGMRLVKSRKQSYRLSGYQLRAEVVVSGYNFDLSIVDASEIVRILDCTRIVQNGTGQTINPPVKIRHIDSQP